MTVDTRRDGRKLPPPTPPLASHLSNPDIDTATPLRLYQIWKGNNRLIFEGRIVLGPEVRSLFVTIFLILAPVTLLCVFVSKGLISTLQHGTIILVVCVLFIVYVILLLFLIVGGDPGIIPRNLVPLESEGDSFGISADWPTYLNRVPRSLPSTKSVVVNRIFVRIKYYHTCMLYRPLRCSHYSICNNCVERFDHHCSWKGQCIGKRNYRFFFMFVSSTTILSFYVFALCCVNIKKIMDAYHCGLWAAIAKSLFLEFSCLTLLWLLGL